MFTNLTPSYEFTDGSGFIIDDWENVKEGDTIRIYVPSIMSEIEKNDYTMETINSINSQQQIFLNIDSCPKLPHSVVSLNYVTGKICYDLLLEKSNEKLYNDYKKDPDNAKPITHIPLQSSLKAGDKVYVSSDIGTIGDLYIS